jgi:hypothetical protein
MSDPSAPTAQAAFIAVSRQCWLLTGTLAAVTTGLIVALRLPVEIGRLSLNVVVTLVFLPVAIAYSRYRFDARLAGICDAVALLSSYTLVAAVCIDATTAAGAGVALWDERLLAADHVLHLDWRACLTWLDGHAALGSILDICYRSALDQVGVTILVLGLFGRVRRLQTFVLAMQISLLVCAAAPAFMPALGIYNFLHIVAATDHPHIPLTSMNGALSQILQLRGAAPHIRLDDIEGIVVCPSFHTVLAILFAWAFWTVPVLRWAMLGLNAGMLAATPLSGGHYFVDLVAGAGLALASLRAAGWLVARCYRTSAGASTAARTPAVIAAA